MVDTANVIVDLQWGTIAQGERNGQPVGLDPVAQKEYLDRVARHIDASRAQGIDIVWVTVNDRTEFHPTISPSDAPRDPEQLEKMGFFKNSQPLTSDQTTAQEYYKEWLKIYGPRKNEVIYEKKSFGALADSPELLDHIHQNGWNKIGIIGGNDDVCVMATAIGAAANGIHADIISDLVKSDDDRRLERNGAENATKLARTADQILLKPDTYGGILKGETFSPDLQITEANSQAIRDKIGFTTSSEFLSPQMTQHVQQQQSRRIDAGPARPAQVRQRPASTPAAEAS